MKIMFIAWSRLSRRTKDLANELGAALLFVPDRPPYMSAFRKTGKQLESMRPEIVFVQLPQGPLLWWVLRISKKLSFKIVADVHTGFVYATSLKELMLNRPFNHLLRKTDLVLAHNPLQKELVLQYLKSKEKCLVVYDPLPNIPKNLNKPSIEGLEPHAYITLPVSWSSDEPIDFIVSEFLESTVSREYKLVITNNFRKNKQLYNRVLRMLRNRDGLNKVLFTGYLSDSEYYWLIKHSRLVIAVTTREYTMLSALWDSVGCGTPFIVSESRALRSVIGCYPCFFQLRKTNLSNLLEKCIYEELLSKDLVSVLNRLKTLSEISIRELRKKLDLIM